MTRYSPVNLTPDAADRARRLARHHGLSVGAYIGDLVDAAHSEMFGEDAEPLIRPVVDEQGAPTTFTIEAETPFEVPAVLARAFADNVEQIATKGGSTLEIVEDSALVRVDRVGAGVVVNVSVGGSQTKATFSVHRALKIARALREMVDIFADTDAAAAVRPAA